MSTGDLEDQLDSDPGQPGSMQLSQLRPRQTLQQGPALVERYVQFGVCRPGGHLVLQDFAALTNWVGSNRDPSDSGDEKAEKRD
jgi:hypothetical protein